MDQLLVLSLAMLAAVATGQADDDKFKIVFGSCHHHDKPTPVFDNIARDHTDADVLIFAGDNLYNDAFLCEPWQADRQSNCGLQQAAYSVAKRLRLWGSMFWSTLVGQPNHFLLQHLEEQYAKLARKLEPVLTAFKSKPVLALWDDHDYGLNDAGAELWFKEQSKQLFLDFWRPGETIPEGQGIQTTVEFGEGDRKVQLIMLDTRFYRSELRLDNETQGVWEALLPNILPHHIDHEHATILGDEQWTWLEEQLAKPGYAFKILVSPTQILTAWNGQEAWANFPSEQRHFMRVLHRSGADRLVVLSGDVHYAELSKWDRAHAAAGADTPSFDLYDFTSSGLTEVWPEIYPNEFRVAGSGYLERNFGSLEVDWRQQEVTMRLHAESGEVVFEHRCTLASLTASRSSARTESSPGPPAGTQAHHAADEL